MKNFSLFVIATLLLHAQHSFGTKSFTLEGGKIETRCISKDLRVVFIPTLDTEKAEKERQALQKRATVAKMLEEQGITTVNVSFGKKSCTYTTTQSNDSCNEVHYPAAGLRIPGSFNTYLYFYAEGAFTYEDVCDPRKELSLNPVSDDTIIGNLFDWKE